MMKIKLLITLILISISFINIMPQGLRLSSMGGIYLSVDDPDNSFNPFDMGGNISFLMIDEPVSWLRINPSFNSNWGDYKRIYDSQKNNLYGINFTGVKTLGSDGTFIGNVNYVYDSRIDVNRSIKYDTYNGEAFFITDSTMGDTRFTGPSVNFGYSFELINDLYLGASAGYKILNGLKKIYSQTSTVYRYIDGSAGLTYKLVDNLFVAGGFSVFNSQESLTAELSNPVDLEVKNFHGDFYALTKRGNGIPEKLKERGYSFNSQLYYQSFDKEAGINFFYGNSNQKFLFSTTVNNVSVTEYEDGYSFFNNYGIEFKGRYDFNPSLTFGITGGYFYDRCWSKISSKELLIWDWNSKNIKAGAGASYKVTQRLLIGLQYNFENIKADSAKYIDFRFIEAKGNNHIFRLGSEYEAIQNIYLRVGGGFGIIGKDMMYGGDNLQYSFATFGLGINLMESISIDLYLGYNNYKPKDSSLSRKFFDGLFTIKLFNI